MNPFDIGARRLHPDACIYCPDPPDTDEHVLAEAVGGRLTAPILCAKHNGNVNRTADEPLAEHYAALTFAAGVRRQRGNSHGKTGTTLRYTDGAGRRTTVFPDGTSEFGLEVERDGARQVVRGSGPLAALAAIARQRRAPGNMILFETISPGVVIPVGVGIVDEVLPGFVKTALHFAAGFMATPPAATMAALRPGILRERPIRVLRQLPFRAPYFDPNGSLRHEVTIYPNGAHAVATIMLFSSMTVTLELPHFGTRKALRYVQLLDGSGPQLLDVDPIPIPHGPLSDREWDGLFATAHAKVYQIFVDRANREVDEIAKAAARVAMGHDAVHPGTVLRWFRAELECKALRAELVDDLVRQAQRRMLRGLPIMDDTDMILR